MVKIRQ